MIPTWMEHLSPDERGRLKNNTQRVFAVLLDGKWHSSVWFSEHHEIGGLRWSARIRELREPRYGSLVIEREKDPVVGGKAERYRLDLNSLTHEWRRRILHGDIETAPARETKTCPTCNGSGKVPVDAPVEKDAFDLEPEW